jgi:uncharacterized surface protein with fasciclin (FAS1) repeats
MPQIHIPKLPVITAILGTTLALIPHSAATDDSTGPDVAAAATPSTSLPIGRPSAANGIVNDVIERRLVGTVRRDLSLEFFTSLLRAATFDGTLRIDGPHTLFLPADRAFAGIPGAQLSAVIHNPVALRRLAKAHLVPGRVSTEDLKNGHAVTALDGRAIRTTAETALSVNGANILGTASTENGVIHIIDRLL